MIPHVKATLGHGTSMLHGLQPSVGFHANGIINATGISLLLWAIMLRLIFG